MISTPIIGRDRSAGSGLAASRSGGAEAFAGFSQISAPQACAGSAAQGPTLTLPPPPSVSQSPKVGSAAGAAWAACPQASTTAASPAAQTLRSFIAQRSHWPGAGDAQ